MSRVPLGVPSITYCRVVPNESVSGKDLVTDGNVITLYNGGGEMGSSYGMQNVVRHEVQNLVERSDSDMKACLITMGGAPGIGAGFHPLKAVVYDAATTVIFVMGSRATNKSQFIKRTLLPHLARDAFMTTREKEESSSASSAQSGQGFVYKTQLTLSCFEIQDEIITDLLRPENRGMNVGVTAEDGVHIQSIHREVCARV